MSVGIQIRVDPMIAMIAKEMETSRILRRRTHDLIAQDRAVVNETVNGMVISHASDELLDLYYLHKGVQ